MIVILQKQVTHLCVLYLLNYVLVKPSNVYSSLTDDENRRYWIGMS